MSLSRQPRGTPCARPWTPGNWTSRGRELLSYRCVAGGPRSRLLERGARCQHGFVGEAATGDLEPDRQPISRQTCRYRGGGMAREVEGVGEAPAKEPVDTLPLDLD